MSTCFDVYVLPGVCGDIQTYPSAVHPSGGGGGPSGPGHRTRGVTRHVINPAVDDEEAILIALSLLL
jgi:hypothetical protein